MDVYEVRITKKELQSLPDAERILVLQFGHVCNELSFLNKLLLMVSDTKTEGLERKAMVAQAMIVIRLYIGKVFEAWRMLERDYFGSQLSRSLDTKLSPEGKSSLDALKVYFGKKNLLSSIRNDFSFHYWAEHLPKAMNACDDSREFQVILGETYANTLFKFSDEFVPRGMLEASGESEPEAAMDKVVEDLVSVGGKTIHFLAHGLVAVFENCLGKSWKDLEYTVHKIEPKKPLGNLSCLSFSGWRNGMSPNTSLNLTSRAGASRLVAPRFALRQLLTQTGKG